MGTTTELRSELKKIFVPLMEQNGFVREKFTRIFWEFRRSNNNYVDVFDIQWEKYDRPRFTINFKPRIAIDVHSEQLLSELINSTNGGRLQPKLGGSLACWFRQDRTLLSWLKTGQRLKAPLEVVNQVIELFPELESYWEYGKLGQHMALSPIAIPKGVVKNAV